MKKAVLSLLLFVTLIGVVTTSCHKIVEKLFPAFDVELANVSVTIPVTLAHIDFSSSNTISFDLDSAIKSYTANTFGINALTSVKVKSIGIFLENGDALNNVSSFETLSLSFYSNTKATPVLIAQQSISNTAADNLNITPTNSPELKEYLKGNELTYTVAGNARRTTTKPLNATVLVTLAIK